MESFTMQCLCLFFSFLNYIYEINPWSSRPCYIMLFILFYCVSLYDYMTIHPFYCCGYLGCFQYLLNMNKAVMNILDTCFGGCMNSSFGYFSRGGIVGSWGVLMFHFSRYQWRLLNTLCDNFSHCYIQAVIIEN